MTSIKSKKQKIKPCLWFDTNAKEAAEFYTSVFKNSKMGKISYYGKNMPLPEGTVLTVSFKIAGQEFLGLNGGPIFKFTEAISFVVSCDTQKEIDYYWQKLTSDGGAESQCGWLKDKFGLSWQIVPSEIEKLLSGNKERIERVMNEIFKMRKLDLKILRDAYSGKI